MEKGVLPMKGLFIHNMDDEREKADNTGGVYRKSLLYLVSRSLEDLHKMPILGMDAAWHDCNCEDKESGGFHSAQESEIAKWEQFIKDGNKPILYNRTKKRVKTNLKPDFIDLGHGSFDNDIDVVEHTLKKIKGGKLRVPIMNLHGY